MHLRMSIEEQLHYVFVDLEEADDRVMREEMWN